jgi:pimeloyl-ACP methyl ester carboxylesterase
MASLRMGGNVMNRGITAAFVPRTEPEETGLAVHTHCRSGWRRVATAAVALSGLVAGLSPAPAAAEAPVPVLDWQPCAAPSQHGFDCATAQVPLDYGDPQGATIELAVIRHPATDPAHRLGTFFVNFGGPGAPGTAALPQLYERFAAELRARFDVVSWDPRGVGASTAVQCFDTPDDAERFFAGLPEGFPVGRAEERAWIRGYARLGELCGERNGDLLAHVSTAETARDLDLLRQAVGDPQLNYQGNSYGSFLGAVYANLFPDIPRDGHAILAGEGGGGDGDHGGQIRVTEVNDLARRHALLTTALVAAQLPDTVPEARMLHAWFDTWAGLGDVVTGMNRQGTMRGSLSPPLGGGRSSAVSRSTQCRNGWARRPRLSPGAPSSTRRSIR